MKGRYGFIVCPPGYVPAKPLSYAYERPAPVAYSGSSANAVAFSSAEAPTAIVAGPSGTIASAWPVRRYYSPHWRNW